MGGKRLVVAGLGLKSKCNDSRAPPSCQLTGHTVLLPLSPFLLVSPPSPFLLIIKLHKKLHLKNL